MIGAARDSQTAKAKSAIATNTNFFLSMIRFTLGPPQFDTPHPASQKLYLNFSQHTEPTAPTPCQVKQNLFSDNFDTAAVKQSKIYEVN
jgi:hypothetical protein